MLQAEVDWRDWALLFRMDAGNDPWPGSAVSYLEAVHCMMHWAQQTPSRRGE